MGPTGIVEGTSSGRSVAVGAVRVSDIVFAADRHLPWHTHPNSCLAVVVDGAVRKDFGTRQAVAETGSVVTMPAEEPHDDLFGPEGARIVVVESPNGVESVECFRSWPALLISLRIRRELEVSDPFTPLAVEGLALELAAVGARGVPIPRPAKWLRGARDLLLEQLPEPPVLSELAAQVGVHPGHLARTFRAHFGESVGECARRLRLEWAAERLVRTETGLACLAVEAGFADQSHFTRAFKRRFGVTPGRYRAAHR